METKGTIGQRPLSDYVAADIYNDGDGFELPVDEQGNPVGTVQDIVNNDTTLDALATEIAADLGLEGNVEAIEDIKALIRLEAQQNPSASVEEFLTSVITTLQEIATVDDDGDPNLSEAELAVGIAQEQLGTGEEGATPLFDETTENLEVFMMDVLTSIAGDDGTIGVEDADLLAELLGIDPMLAEEIITLTGGNLEGIMGLIAGSEEIAGDEGVVGEDNELTLADIQDLEENLSGDNLDKIILASDLGFLQGGFQQPDHTAAKRAATEFLGGDQHRSAADFLYAIADANGDGVLSEEEALSYLSILTQYKEDLDTGTVEDHNEFVYKSLYENENGEDSWTSLSDDEKNDYSYEKAYDAVNGEGSWQALTPEQQEAIKSDASFNPYSNDLEMLKPYLAQLRQVTQAAQQFSTAAGQLGSTALGVVKGMSAARKQTMNMVQ